MYRPERWRTDLSESSFDVAMPGEPLNFRFSHGEHRDHIANLILQQGLAQYEAPTPSIFVALCREASGVVLDVGANTGLFALLAAAANPGVRVCAFEPLASVRALLEGNIALNPNLAQRIAVQPFGLSRSSGSFTFYETINSFGLVTTSSSLELSHAKEVGDYVTQTIETQSLDQWGERLGPDNVHLMKLDVEGHEHAVIEGGRRFLAKHRPYITIEVLGSAETHLTNAFLIEAGYVDFAMAPGLLRHCASVRHHADAWNHLLCPAERVSRVLAILRDLGLGLEIG